MSQSYTIFFPDVESYLQFCGDPGLDRLRPPRCGHCGHPVLHGHRSYKRNVWAKERSWRIPVFRFRCANPECKRTCSVLPSFVGRYERFVWDVQEQVCTNVDTQHSMEEAGRVVPAPVGPICTRTVWRWFRHWRAYMEELEDEFWQYVISLHPTLHMPRGRDRPTRRLQYWKKVWMQLVPKKVNVRLFHGLYRLRQSCAAHMV